MASKQEHKPSFYLQVDLFHKRQGKWAEVTCVSKPRPLFLCQDNTCEGKKEPTGETVDFLDDPVL
jgi:hypothetical protein